MKLRMFKMLDPWPDNDHYNRLRSKGFRPRLVEGCEVIGETGTSTTDVQDERQYMPSHFRLDVRLEHCEVLRQAVLDVQTGRATEKEWTGNAWTIYLRQDGAEFEYSIMDGEPGGKVGLETYRRALEAWRDFLADESCDERIVEIPD